MKATLSCVAVLLFAAVANCVPVTKVDQATSNAGVSTSDSGSNASDADSGSNGAVNNIFTTTSITTTQINLPDGTTVPETCNTTTVTDTQTLDTVITAICTPSNDTGSSNDSSSSGDGSNDQGVGVAIVGTGTISANDLAAALGSQDDTPPASTDNSGEQDQGIGASIIGHGTVSASQVGQSQDTQQTKKRRGVVATSNTNVKTTEGSVLEKCRIQLNPESTGQFTETQDCEVSLEPNIGDTNAGGSGAAPPSPVNPSPIAVTSASIPAVVSSTSPNSVTVSSTANPTPIPEPSPPALAPAPSASSATSAPELPSPSPVSESSPLSAGAIIMGTGVTSLDLTSSSAPTVSPISAAEDNTSTFTMPGRQISILPVGLAVFAGLSVIALIVVGVVTYERTKYRKNFRNRKLAEQMKAKADMLSERSMV